jgi:hypothetical protein
VSADIIILPVVRGLNEPEAIEIDDTLLMARAGAMCSASVGVNVSLSRVEIWFAHESEAQELFDTIKRLMPKRDGGAA